MSGDAVKKGCNVQASLKLAKSDQQQQRVAPKQKLIIILVGLPARGKTFLCTKIMCYLNWCHPLPCLKWFCTSRKGIFYKYLSKSAGWTNALSNPRSAVISKRDAERLLHGLSSSQINCKGLETFLHCPSLLCECTIFTSVR